MKTKSLLLSAFVALMGFVACESLDPNHVQFPNGEAKTYTVHLGVSGEIDLAYNPLTRFTSDNRDLYAIQVWHKPAVENVYELFAYGLFDNLENAKLELTENYDYRFGVIMIDDAKDKIFSDSILIDSNYYLAYDKPFFARNNYGAANNSNSMTKLTNEFIVTDTCYFPGANLTSNNPLQTFGNNIDYRLKDGKIYSHPINVDVYYGEIEKYSPTEGNTQIDIYLKRMNYGLKVVASDFFNNGTISVQLGNEFTHTLTPENREMEQIFAHDDLHDWYAFDDMSKATVSQTIDFAWTKADETVVNWQSFSCKFYRLKQTVVNLDYYSNGTAGTQPLIMHIEETPIESNYNEINYGADQSHYDW